MRHLSSSSSSSFSSSASSPHVVHLLFLGELDKWVPFSPQRFSSLAFLHTHRSLLLAIQGGREEEVEVFFAVLGEEEEGEAGREGEVEVVRVKVTMDWRGEARLRVRVEEEGGGEGGRKRRVIVATQE